MAHGSDYHSRRTVLKRTAVGASGLGLTAVVGCLGGGSGGNEITIASTYEPGHVVVDAAEEFKSIVEAESDDELEVTVSEGGAYGGEEEISDLCREGTVEAHADSRWPYMMYAEDYSFVNIPIVFEDYEHLTRVTEHEDFQPAHEEMRSDGNQFMMGEWIYRGLRHFTSNEPVREPSDVDGIELRLPEIDEWVDIWSEIGANPTPVSLDELYSGLQTGVVEASEGDVPQIHSFNLQEVQDYLSLTGHHVQVGALYMNDEFYQGLDDAHQELVDEASVEATQQISADARENEETLFQELEDAGMEIIEDVDQDAFRNAAEPVVEEMFGDWAGEWDDWRQI
ncbi:TRAP transporter substrate-binding protein [Natrialba taiwanensis]|uniref:TRAP dicarboxylate transporter subunit DctP n=1 Tax=Natrialba taiwanensis DSM 12281 TaxID=1230458 RepID=M0ACS7_9EURY|nr:TRAP transporter substrate-binding protein [Natrialba taiwanensis]ELY96344.1 TRAP dicarboxylate transporter subunit DctP [Natrialba taiwanensis DSM 12281]